MWLHVYKTTDEHVECGSFRDLIVAMKETEKVFKHKVRQQVKVNKLQFDVKLRLCYQ